jgi:hypothetical protein
MSQLEDIGYRKRVFKQYPDEPPGTGTIGDIGEEEPPLNLITDPQTGLPYDEPFSGKSLRQFYATSDAYDVSGHALRQWDKPSGEKQLQQGFIEGFAGTVDFLGNIVKGIDPPLTSEGPLGPTEIRESNAIIEDALIEGRIIPPREARPLTFLRETGKAVGAALPFSLAMPFAASNAILPRPMVPFFEGFVDAYGFRKKATFLAKRGLDFGRRNLQRAGETARKSPFKFYGPEFLGAAGVGGGNFVAERMYPDSPVAKFFTASAGGFLYQGPLFTYGWRFSKYAVNSMRGFWSDKDMNMRAAYRAHRAARNEAKDVLDEIDAVTFGDDDNIAIHPGIRKYFTPSQMTVRQEFYDLELALHEMSGTTYQRHLHLANLNKVVRDMIYSEDDVFDVERTREFFEASQEYQMMLLRGSVDQQMIKADDIIASQFHNMSAEDAEVVVHEQLSFGLEAALADQDKVWSFPGAREMNFSTKPAVDVMRDLFGEMDEVAFIYNQNISDILKQLFGDVVPFKEGEVVPGVEVVPGAREFIQGKFPEFATAEEIFSMRKLLRSTRDNLKLRSRAGTLPEGMSIRDTLRSINKVDNALLQMLGSNTDLQEGSTMWKNYKHALTYSTNFNNVYNEGPVGEIFGTSTSIEKDPIRPQLTLTETLRVRDAEAALNIDMISDAALGVSLGVSPQDLDRLRITGDAMVNWIREDFLETTKAIQGGQLQMPKVTAVEDYLSTHRRLFDRFPKMRQSYQDLIDTGNVLAWEQANMKDVGAHIGSAKYSRATMFLQRDPTKYFKELAALGDYAPDQMEEWLDATLTLLAEDGTGGARKGFEVAFFKFVHDESLRNADDALSRKYISGIAMREVMSRRGVKKIMNSVLTIEAADRLDMFANAAYRVDLSFLAKMPDEGVLGDVPGRLLSVFSRVMAARLSAAGIGGGTVQIPQIAVENAKFMLNSMTVDGAVKYLTDAIFADSPEMLQDLLKPITDHEEAIAVTRRINAWLATVVIELGHNMNEDREDENR